METTGFLTLVPSLVAGGHQLFNTLVPVALVICFAGLVVYTFRAQTSNSYSELTRAIVRLGIIAVVIPQLGTWGDTLISVVDGVVADTGGGNGINLLQEYQAAVARKLGTAAAAANINQGNGFTAPVGPDAGGSLVTPSSNGNNTVLTHYAYPGDSDLDGNSSQGIGSGPFSAPGSLTPMYSVAMTPLAAQQYGITQLGQTFTFTTSTGQSYQVQYADVAPQIDPNTGANEGSRIDMYDPNNSLGGGNNFEETVASVNNIGASTQGQTGAASMLPNPGGSIGDQILWAFVLGLSWIAQWVMLLMRIVQEVLFFIELSLCPVLLALAMIPATAHITTRYIMGLVALSLWPLAWAICNLITLGLLDLGVNTSNNSAIGIVNALGASSTGGALAGLAYLAGLAVWVIGSTLAAPIVVGRVLGVGATGNAALAGVFGATVGAGAARTAAGASAAVGGVPGMVSGVGNVISTASAMRMNGNRANYASRPVETEKDKTA